VTAVETKPSSKFGEIVIITLADGTKAHTTSAGASTEGHEDSRNHNGEETRREALLYTGISNAFLSFFFLKGGFIAFSLNWRKATGYRLQYTP